MSNKLRKIAASVMAVATLTTSAMGINAIAYAPTITRNFTVGNSTATATAFRDSTHAYAKTALSGGRCDVYLSFCGKTASYTYYLNTTPNANINGTSGTASSSHSASKGGFSNSTNITV